MELQPIATLRAVSEISDLAGAAPNESRRHAAKRFDDILGQALAGPLFATWTPPIPVNPVGSSTGAGNSTVPALDPDARRGGRRRSRR
jgi:hypothetical protein